jgi:hypothetical protein
LRIRTEMRRITGDAAFQKMVAERGLIPLDSKNEAEMNVYLKSDGSGGTRSSESSASRAHNSSTPAGIVSGPPVMDKGRGGLRVIQPRRDQPGCDGPHPVRQRDDWRA